MEQPLSPNNNCEELGSGERSHDQREVMQWELAGKALVEITGELVGFIYVGCGDTVGRDMWVRR